ncbi:MAG: YraN family protein [Clostridia bacterium]|jgi:putative endonuclease|nr:YraN family protein [Clostridia bacterium]
MNSRLLGAFGEQEAAKYLRSKGYKIMTANFKTYVGEIDIIAETKDNICFVEVKTRTEGAMLPPSSAVNSHKEKNIEGSALIYINRYKVKKQPRYDIIEIIVSENKVLSLNHIEGAF